MNNIDYNFYNKKDFFTYDFLKKADETLVSFLKLDIETLYQYPDELPALINQCKKNIAYFLNFNEKSEVLYVNDCFGFVLKDICEKVKHVTALEFSKLTAEIVDHNLSKQENYNVVVGVPNDVQFDKKFDYIILNDVLEFSALFFKEARNPYKSLIEHFKGFLKPKGYLVLEISNRYGLRNWASALDEFKGEKYSSLMGYPANEEIKSFNKKELDDLFRDCSFKHINYFYPVLSHNNYQLILSEKYPVSYYIKNDILSCVKNETDKFETLYDKTTITNSIIDDNKFKFFVNSYLVILGNEKCNSEKLYTKFSEKFIKSVIKKDEKLYVHKIPRTNSAKIMLQNEYDFYEYEKNRFKEYEIQNIKLCECEKDGENVFLELIDGITLSQLINEAIKANDKDLILKYLIEYKSLICYLYPNFVIQDYQPNPVTKSIFGDYELKTVACVKDVNINLTFDNIFKKDNEYFLVDYKVYRFGQLPLNYIIAAGIFDLSVKYGVDYVVCLKILDFDMKDILIFKKMYDCFKLKRGL